MIWAKFRRHRWAIIEIIIGCDVMESFARFMWQKGNMICPLRILKLWSEFMSVSELYVKINKQIEHWNAQINSIDFDT